MKGPLQLHFVTSGDRLEAMPAVRSELAVVGRSNVGKSSLLNALANQVRLAHVSKTPGRTRLLNAFELVEAGIEPGGFVVDCPGYGYAKAPRQMREGWQQMIEGYLLGRAEIVNILVLVDGEIGPTALDRTMLEWLRYHDRPFVVVATKHDKVKSSGREKRKSELAEGCELDRSDVVWVSSAKNVNIDVLRQQVRGWLS